jgi:hypothetical protein
MRRTTVFLTVLTLIGAGAPQATGAPDTGPIHTAFEFADASWFVREEGKPFMYIGGGYRNTDPLGRTRTYGFAGKIKCWEKRTKHFGITICFGGVRPKKIDADLLQFDPLLDETSISFGKTQISWKGRGDYSPDVWPIADPDFGAAVYASLDRDARAKGKVLGLNLKTRGWKDWGYLSEGIFGGVITKNGKVVFNDDGTLTYRMKFRTPLRGA